jgi:hypothetical protein
MLCRVLCQTKKRGGARRGPRHTQKCLAQRFAYDTAEDRNLSQLGQVGRDLRGLESFVKLANLGGDPADLIGNLVAAAGVGIVPSISDCFTG